MKYKFYFFPKFRREKVNIKCLIICNNIYIVNPFYIYFTKETIRKMSEKFFAKNKHNNTDINHDENITTENTLIESWISESIKHDKSYKYGFALPEGTWYVSYKINDDEYTRSYASVTG